MRHPARWLTYSLLPFETASCVLDTRKEGGESIQRGSGWFLIWECHDEWVGERVRGSCKLKTIFMRENQEPSTKHHIRKKYQSEATDIKKTSVTMPSLGGLLIENICNCASCIEIYWLEVGCSWYSDNDVYSDDESKGRWVCHIRSTADCCFQHWTRAYERD